MSCNFLFCSLWMIAGCMPIWRHPLELAYHVERRALSALPPSRRNAPLVLGVHLGLHDANFALALGGEILGVVELERYHRIKHFGFEYIENKTEEGFKSLVLPALDWLCTIASKKVPSCIPTEYDIVALVGFGELMQNWLEDFIVAASWVYVDHHHAHAAGAWMSSPFYYSAMRAREEVTVVISYDGQANDGYLRAFIGHSGNATLLPLGDAISNHSFGEAYMNSAIFVRDLAWGSPYGAIPPFRLHGPHFPAELALPGAFMAFAALGLVRKEWRAGAKLLLSNSLWHSVAWNDALWPSPYGGKCSLVDATKGLEHNRIGRRTITSLTERYFSCEGANEAQSRSLDQDFAATVQFEFEQLVLIEVRSRFGLLGSMKATSLVITGGCALNVKVNSMLARQLNLPVHVPSAPNDSGLGLGAAWLIRPPAQQSVLHFAGASLTLDMQPLSMSKLEALVMALGGTQLQSVVQLAEMLMNNSIIAVARGRAEFGPRALGHRSFLSNANNAEQKQRLNRLKHRRWYRPCAPIILAEDLEHVFEPGPDLLFGSPYMSFAPPLQSWVKNKLPGIAHIDDTARPQGVRRSDDPWMYALLEGVRTMMAANLSQSGPAVGVLINTSLNPKGEPIASDVLQVLSVFCLPGGDELDFALLEETWLIERHTAMTLGLCEKFHGSFTGGHWADGLPPI